MSTLKQHWWTLPINVVSTLIQRWRVFWKEESFLVTRPSTCSKFNSCFRILQNDEKRTKTNLRLGFYESQLQLFSGKNIPQTASKTFASLFFYRSLEIQIKQLPERPRLILNNYVYISWRTLKLILIYLANYFGSLLIRFS